MLQRIEAHNRLNGYLFVTAEFVVIGAAVGGFGLYYAGHGRLLAAILALGITGNSLVIVILCIRSLLRGEKGVGMWKIYTDASVRQKVMEKNPRLSSDTLLITIAVLVPFTLVLLGLWATRQGYFRA